MIYYTKIKAIEAVQLRWTQWNEVCDFLGKDFPKGGAKNSEDTATNNEVKGAK